MIVARRGDLQGKAQSSVLEDGAVWAGWARRNL
jgi:hypothetical protein